ncbi:MAG: Sec-independent protein translocase protein TatB [Candidatus Tokpelaia sp. JSC085]|nr:MAG: Sec-independent protein translocase protein TatB [Candidatus Tokpelaia sp. JSC085]
MFGIDSSELLIIVIVLIIVVGPEDFPKIIGVFCTAKAHMRILTQEIRELLSEAVHTADMSIHSIKTSEDDQQKNMEHVDHDCHSIIQDKDIGKEDPAKWISSLSGEKSEPVLTDTSNAVVHRTKEKSKRDCAEEDND